MKALILNILIPVIIALLPYQITIIPMSQETYQVEQDEGIVQLERLINKNLIILKDVEKNFKTTFGEIAKK